MIKVATDSYTYAIAIDKDDAEFYSYLILGQQVYIAALYGYIFSNVSQNNRLVRQLLRFPKEELLRQYIMQVDGDSFWTSENYGVGYKIKKSFLVLGVQFERQGFDCVYEGIKQASDLLFEQFLRFPVVNYKDFLNKYTSSSAHSKVLFDVSEDEQSSEMDPIWKATGEWQGRRFESLGYNEENAIERLSRKIVLSCISENERHFFALAHGYKPIIKHRLELGVISKKQEEKLESFAQKHNLDSTLLRIALLRKDQLNNRYLMNTGLLDSFSIKTIESIHGGLHDWGRKLTLLLGISYCKNNDLFDPSFGVLFSEVDSRLSFDEISTQIEKLFDVESLLLTIHENISVPSLGKLSDKEKQKASAAIISVYFLSNFTPEKKFVGEFDNLFRDFYSAQWANNHRIDYRFLVLSYLSELGITHRTNHHEATDGLEDNIRRYFRS